MRLLPETLLMSIIVTGLIGALEAHQSATPCLDRAQELAGILRPNDLLLRGWDSISILYSAFWEHGAKTFDVPSVASSSGPQTVQLLHDEIATDQGQRFSLGILDMPENGWTPFLGDNVQLPYRSLDPIRNCPKPVASRSCSDGNETPWKLPSDCC
jgi:hypothetical protein